ncbi:MAG: ribosome small subunit-dependent GTPase A [Ruminococcus sp.]|nr:ribosome small subunit-dependent GTPase A [Ruminococcus sp.]
MSNNEGILLKVLGGFYYVESDNEIFECKARGSFRKSGSSPLVGDRVRIAVQKEGFSSIEEILPRKNQLRRPPVANLDVLVIVCSTVDPSPNFTIIDKMTATAINNDIQPIIVISKNDIADGEEIARIYRNAKFPVFCTSPENPDAANELKGFLKGKTAAFTGNSGVGKSTLLNQIFPQLELETGGISRKLGRGRHTTRAVELFNLDGCYIADTPGFSTVDLQRYELIDKNRLQYCFPEFEEYLGECMFSSCSHICEKGCSVLNALSEGKIEKTRHASYVNMYDEVKDIKEWQLKGKN